MSFTFSTLISLLTVAATVVHAFTFNFTSPPTQCANATLQWSGGSPPFSLLLVPTGALHPVEVRVITDFAIPSGNSFSFQLKYPSNSTFVAVMSDATGFGAGGTTSVTTVAASKDKSCIAKSQVAPEFFIFTNPPVPQECSPVEISYNSDAHPPVDVFLVVPGGTSSRIESGSPANRSFEWTPALNAGTQMMIVAGDKLGPGKGGSTDILTVASGNSTSCMNAQAAGATTTATATVTSVLTPSATRVPSSATARLSLSLWATCIGFFFVFFQ